MEEAWWDRRPSRGPERAEYLPLHSAALPWVALGTGALGAVAAQLILLLLGAECAVALLLAAPGPGGVVAAGVFSAAWSVLAAVCAPFAGGVMAGSIPWRGGAAARALGGVVIWAVNLLVTLWFGYTNVASMAQLAAGRAVAHADRVMPTLQQYLPGLVAHAASEGTAAGGVGAGMLWTVALTLLFSCCAAMAGVLLGAGSLTRDETRAEQRVTRPSWYRYSDVPV